MNKKPTNLSTEEIESQLRKLGKRISVLEKHAGIKVKRTRRTREYTDEERAAIRERLKAGHEAAEKKWET